MIDLYSHFGTRYSYATIASVVGRALHAAGLLRGVYNLDSEWHGDYADLQAIGSQPRGSHVVVIAAPSHYVCDLLACYTPERAALFVSQNTDELCKEHIETVSEFGAVIVPSSWCLQAVQQGLLALEDSGERGITDPLFMMLPLGVDPSFSKATRRAPGWTRELPFRPRVHALHVTSDQCWPGRKGTAELIDAWAHALKCGWIAPGTATLTVHLPEALERDVLYRIADHGIQDSVQLAIAGERGSEAVGLASLYEQSHVVIQPSRCEGFGMMILAALVSGTPLLTTYVTGHADFLSQRPGWIAIPTVLTGDLAFEHGAAPVIEVQVLAQTLGLALHHDVLDRLRALSFAAGEWGTWPAAMRVWVDHLRNWMKETSEHEQPQQGDARSSAP